MVPKRALVGGSRARGGVRSSTHGEAVLSEREYSQMVNDRWPSLLGIALDIQRNAFEICYHTAGNRYSGFGARSYYHVMEGYPLVLLP